MKNTHLVFVPSPGIGHMVSTVEFSKRLTERDDRLSIFVLVIRSPAAPDLDSYTQQVDASNTRIRFIYIPPVDPPPAELLKSPENYFSLFLESHKSHVKDAIIEQVLSEPFTSLAGFVVDLFCSSMIDVANELNVPSYVFFTSGAAFLGFILYLPIHYNQNGKEFEATDCDSIIPTYTQSVPSSVIPSFAFNKDGGYASILKHATRFKETKGIIVNTFTELESHPVKSLKSDNETPPIYTVGPVVDLGGQKQLDTGRKKIMKWLDDQPSSSVVFLCFGSMGSFEPDQMNQMAIAVEQSGYRFLWSVRSGSKDFTKGPGEYSNFFEIFPDGFLERNKNRGLVCGWAPQVEVLAHEAVGGFVSHCGWNSILESLWHGVPIATWPLYAEQQINAFQLVRELELAVQLTLDYRVEYANNLLMAEEIEKSIRSLMNIENPIRKKVKEMKGMSRKAIENGGSSFISFGRLIEDLYVNKAKE
ncbi:hypothetical protein ACH5RR_003123 [Cinchona calisaya]|uniref:Glycosyltransferase n=1 Tax=Cinchona calisaya TaxID=153742 RepID=A0ABD3ATX4_9GENT